MPGALLPQTNAGNHKRILIVTDAWEPQTNGVVTTMKSLRHHLRLAGYRVLMLTPQQFSTIPSIYPGVRLALPPPPLVSEMIDKMRPDRILIATEGPLGLAARLHCVINRIPFVTSYTTRWPEYCLMHWKFPPLHWGYKFMQWFHSEATATMVATPSLLEELRGKGFHNTVLWSRGVDTDFFHPLPPTEKLTFMPDLPRPLYLYVGRISKEKNLETFLKQDLPGSKVLIGQGPDLEDFRTRFPAAHFTGPMNGPALARAFACGDVFVFPSKTDTFGLVILEALASGLPVVAFDVTGPKDILAVAGTAPPAERVGFLAKNERDLREMALEALRLSQKQPHYAALCQAYALPFSWQHSVERLIAHTPVISAASLF
ncbi:MAG: glycosyltransferase family 4 protein [Candidatus Melainabacteria bacterium]